MRQPLFFFVFFGIKRINRIHTISSPKQWRHPYRYMSIVSGLLGRIKVSSQNHFVPLYQHQRDDHNIPSRLVELSFTSAKLPSNISIYKIIFNVSPSIRSSVQCQKCLRFEHTQKFCRSRQHCNHCDTFDHDASLAESYLTSVHCKANHPSTDRLCTKWSTQKDIKKIVTTNNVSYFETTQIKHSYSINPAFSFIDVAMKKVTLYIEPASLSL